MKRLSLHILIACLSTFIAASYEILGVPNHISNNIINRLAHKVQSDLTPSYQQLEQIRHETIEAIKPFGYFTPSVKVSVINTSVEISIQLGEQLYINKIEFSITDEVIPQEVTTQLHKTAQSFTQIPFTTENLAALQEEMENTLQTLGYADNHVQRIQSVIDLTSIDSNHVQLGVTLGQKFYFGNVTTSNQDDNKCVNKYLTFEAGDTYSYQKLQETHSNFANYGTFKDYKIKSTPRSQSPNTIDVDFSYSLPDPVEYSVGFGLISSSSEKESAFEPNFMASLIINNIMDCGGRIINSINYANQDSQISSDWLIPSQSSLTDFYTISATVRQFLQQSEDAGKYFMLSLQAFKHFKQVSIIPSLHYLIETSSINNPNIDDNPDKYLTKLFYPKLKLKYHYRYANGYLKAKAKAMGSMQEVYSEISFLKLSANAKNVFNLPSFLFASEMSIGNIQTDQFDQLPLSMQFTLGGPESLRGVENHKFNQGSEFFLIRNTAMYRINQILFGGFIDTGYCLTPENNEQITTVGIAAAYETPYSRFNISLGKPVSQDGQMTFLFSIDPEV